MKKIIVYFLMAMLLLPSVCFAHTMPDSEFCFGNLTFGAPMSKMTALFGRDMERIEIENAMFTLITYKYSGISATAWSFAEQEMPEEELPIRGISITSSTAATRSGYLTTPSGFCVGMPYAKVVERYGAVEVFKIPGYMDVYAYEMPGNAGRQIAFMVDKEGIIREIRLATEV